MNLFFEYNWIIKCLSHNIRNENRKEVDEILASMINPPQNHKRNRSSFVFLKKDNIKAV